MSTKRLRVPSGLICIELLQLLAWERVKSVILGKRLESFSVTIEVICVRMFYPMLTKAAGRLTSPGCPP